MLPQFEKFLHPVLDFLKDGKEHNLSEIRQHIIKHFSLTAEDIQIKTAKGTQSQLYNRVQWSTTYLKKAGLIERPKTGICKITESGLKALSCGMTIDLNYLRNNSKDFVEFSKGNDDKTKSNTQTVHPSTIEAVAETPEDAIERNFSLVNQNLADELLQKVKSIDPRKFEELVVKLLGKMGYGAQIESSASVTQYVKDGGIDGIIKEDKLGLDTIYIQAKRWDNVVTVKEIRSFAGSLDEVGGSKGVFITTSSFTKDALAFSPKNKKIILIDGLQLCYYMIEFNLGVSTKETFEIKRIDMDFFTEDE